VDYEDRIRIATPEGVDLELVLGGVGSRFTSAMVDFIIQTTAVVVCALVFMLGVGGGIGAALTAIASFVILFVYDVAFEVWNGGRTPGKRLNGLRVVVADGRPITFVRSAARNLMRIIDVYVFFVGAFVILVTKQNQRLGDLIADTLVVRELAAPSAVTRMEPSIPAPAPIPVDMPAWDVSAVTADELAAVRSFLMRRNEITSEARVQISGMLAQKLRPKVVGIDTSGLADELFLSELARVKAARM
jgi:uncharacterized RDD family membrane protein YckC